MDKSPDAFRTISEVAADLDLPQHVLRFWETRFSQIKPMKRTGGRRYYRPDDVELVRAIKGLLYGQGYTIKGVQRLLKENGVRAVAAAAHAPEARPQSSPESAQVESAQPARVPPEHARPAQVELALEPAQTGAPVAGVAIESPVAAPAQSLLADAAAERLARVAADLAAELAECARILRAARA